MAAIPLAYNIRSLLRRKVTTLLTTAGVGLAVGILLVVMMLAHGFRTALIESGSPDNVIVLRASATSETSSALSREEAAIVKALPEVARGDGGMLLFAPETVAAVNLPRRGQPGKTSNVTVRGIAPASVALRRQVHLIDGRLPNPGTPEVLAGRSAARGFDGCQVGGTVQMGPQTWTVVGVFDAGGTAFESELWADSDLAIEAFGRGGYSSATFALADPALDFESVRARIEGDKRLNHVVKHERDYYAATAHNLTMFITIVGSILIVLFSFGAVLGAMITMYAFVEARTREIGTLRALGFRRRSILTSFLIESALLSLAGAAVASLPAMFLQRLTFSTTNFDTFTDVTWHFRMSPAIFAWGFVFALVMGFVGGLLPAARAARLPIVGALRKA